MKGRGLDKRRNKPVSSYFRIPETSGSASQRLGGNALFIVIVIALIIGILSGSLVLVAYYNRTYVQKTIEIQRVESNLQSAINMLLTESNEGLDLPKILDLFGEERDSVLIRKTRWGLYEVGFCKAFSHDIARTRGFIIGYRPKEVFRSSVYLVDEGGELSIAGSTEIKGTTYLPEAGIQVNNNLSGYYFTGSKLLEGEKKKSSNKLPEIDQSLLEHIIEIIEAKGAFQDVEAEFLTQLPRDSVSRSFVELPLIITNKNPVQIDENLSGQVIVYSDSLISVDSDVRLNNVILIAPQIRIGDRFEGSFQAFATDTIIVGERSNIRYPSVIALIKNNLRNSQPLITLNEKVKYQGVILSYQKAFSTYYPLIKIGKGSEVTGQIYSDGLLETEATIYGSAVTYKFKFDTPSGPYLNHLVNTKVNSLKLSRYYLAPSVFSEKSAHKNIVKWIN